MPAKPKKFDAIAESRKWKQAVGRELDAMSLQERLDYLRVQTDKFYADARVRRKKAAVTH